MLLEMHGLARRVAAPFFVLAIPLLIGYGAPQATEKNRCHEYLINAETELDFSGRAGMPGEPGKDCHGHGAVCSRGRAAGGG